jgi:hypothetical protein
MLLLLIVWFGLVCYKFVCYNVCTRLEPSREKLNTDLVLLVGSLINFTANSSIKTEVSVVVSSQTNL